MSELAGLTVTIVGGGTMGLAAAWALSRRGAKVELFEQHGHVHELGSHGGFTRAFRHAYQEGADYVRLVQRADEEWIGLSERAGETLLVRCGLLSLGPAGDPEFETACAAMVEHEIRHERLSADEAMRRYPFTIPAGWEGCFAPDSGYLRIGPCLDALRREAEQAGARLRYGVQVRELQISGDRPRVILADGEIVASDRVVVSAGAGAPSLLPTQLLGTPLTVLRRVLAWTAPRQDPRLRALPVWAAFAPEGFFYGFPESDEGVSGNKLACHVASASELAWMNEPTTPAQVDREIHERDLAPLCEFMTQYFPAALGPFVHGCVCLYTNTPSGDFWLDRLPEDPRVIVAAGFSGHGFKFAPAIGLAIAELLEHGHSSLALRRFSASVQRA